MNLIVVVYVEKHRTNKVVDNLLTSNIVSFGNPSFTPLFLSKIVDVLNTNGLLLRVNGGHTEGT